MRNPDGAAMNGTMNFRSFVLVKHPTERNVCETMRRPRGQKGAGFTAR